MTETEKKPKSAEKKSKCGNFLLSVILLLLGTISASFISTKTWDFGGQFSNLARQFRSERTFTSAELAQYDGSDPTKPIYLAINGKVYDVTAGKSYYGKDGSYASFSGKDASRAYITGCFQTHLTHDLRGLSEQDIEVFVINEALNSWIDFYEKSKKYFYVGRVIHDPIDPNSPIPEPCQQ